MILRNSTFQAEVRIGTESPMATFKPILQDPAHKEESRRKSTRNKIPIKLLLDAVLVVSFALFLSANGVQQLYSGPIKTLVESFKRILDDKKMDGYSFYRELDTDVTYYNRQCSSEDISTTDSNDLIIPQNSTIAQAVDTMTTHGAVVVKDILSSDTAAELRDYLETRHMIQDQLPYMEVFFEEIGRLSLGLGTSDHPIIGRALEEVGNHDVLKSTIEGILGPDPAIVEISTLTTLFGAESQGLHTDSDYDGSSLLYSRTFLDSYTLFIALQDTSSRMGATTVCPGTHLCANEDMEDVCLMNGAFEVSSNGHTGKDYGVLQRGDGMMFNQNIWHRGPGNYDLESPINRVNLILTFVRRVDHEKGDVRQQGMGTYYYQRWNMWGHTYQDLKDASTTMVQPWAALKALGLYKSRNSNWGITWTEHFARQLANEMDFYDEIELPLFDKWLRGHALQRFLPLTTNDIGWEQYIEHALENVKIFMKRMHYLIAAIYLDMCLVGGVLFSRKKRPSLRSILLRVIVLHTLVYVIGLTVWQLIGRSDLVQRIETGTFQRLPFPHQRPTELHNTTLPQSVDILIGSRFDAPFLGVNNVLRHHNKRFHLMVGKFSGLRIEIAVAGVYDQVMQMVNRVSPRFLIQDHTSGHWTILDEVQGKEIVRRAILMEAYPVKGVLSSELKAALSDCRFGPFRDTVMAKQMSPLFITSLEELLFRMQDQQLENTPWSENNKVTVAKGTAKHSRDSILAKYPLKTFRGVQRTFHRESTHKSATNNNVLALQDRVLAKYKESGKIMEAVIKYIHDENWYDVEFVATGEVQTIRVVFIERFSPISQGDSVEVEFDDDENWLPAKVVSVHPLARYDVRYENGVEEKYISRGELRFLSMKETISSYSLEKDESDAII